MWAQIKKFLNIKKSDTYSLIAAAIVVGPILLSFDRKVFFIQYYPAVLFATIVVGALYIFWDVFVTKEGHWEFNDEYVGTWRLLGLPLGEWLFFLCVPYSTLFIYEVILAYFGHGLVLPQLGWVQLLLALPFFLLVWPFRRHGYTVLALMSAGGFFLVSAFFAPGLVASSSFWLFLLFAFAVFAIVNGIYTSLPTIRYSPKAILGIRLGTIPIEDFVYNLSYLGLTLVVYLLFKGIFRMA